MRNVFDASVNGKSIIEYSDFMNSILKSPTPKNELTVDKDAIAYSFILTLLKNSFTKVKG